MTLTLRPISEEEFAARRATLVEEYADSVSRNRGVPIDQARADSDRQLRELLPDGVRTESALMLTALLDGEPVGWIWLGLPGTAGGPETAWVYDLGIDAAHRGRGYGREIMRAAERELARRGIGRWGLNVFGDNPVALRLYESLGFRMTAQQMVKTIPPAD